MPTAVMPKGVEHVNLKRPVASPGDHIRDELEARGWTQGDLAAILGRPIQVINAIVNGRKAITPDTAVALGAAFGTTAEMWARLEIAYQLWKTDPADPAIQVRARERGRSA